MITEGGRCIFISAFADNLGKAGDGLGYISEIGKVIMMKSIEFWLRLKIYIKTLTIATEVLFQVKSFWSKDKVIQTT